MESIQHIISVFNNSEIKQNFEYHIIGEGPYRDKLYQEVKNCNAEGSIFLLGMKTMLHHFIAIMTYTVNWRMVKPLVFQLLKQ